MSFDAHKNLAYSTVATPPSPATSGTTLTLATGEGSRFPNPGTDGDFNLTVWPANLIALPTNAEIVRCTARTGDVLTLARAQEGTTARSIVIGDQIAATITAKTLTDIETALGGSLPDPSGQPDGDVLQVLSGVAVWGADPGGGGGAADGSETLYTVSSSGSALTVNYANGAVQDVTLTAACTFTLSAPPSGSAQTMILLLRQDATGGRTVTWPGSVTWLSGAVPTLHTAAGAVDVVQLVTVDAGTTWYGAQVNPVAAGSWTTYNCSPTGFSGTPTQRDSRYSVLGNVCHVYFDVTGTSNATTFTIQLPFAPAGYDATDGLVVLGLDVRNNGTDSTVPGLGQCTSGTTLNLYRDYTGTAWTASGTKRTIGSFAYAI